MCKLGNSRYDDWKTGTSREWVSVTSFRTSPAFQKRCIAQKGRSNVGRARRQFFSLSLLLSFVTMEFATECREYFHHYRTCSLAEISNLVATEIPQDWLPLAYLNSLSADDMTVCLRAIMICWMMSKMTMVPREMQLHVVLPVADVHAKDALVAAGTGSGKSLSIALCILLGDPTGPHGQLPLDHHFSPQALTSNTGIWLQ